MNTNEHNYWNTRVSSSNPVSNERPWKDYHFVYSSYYSAFLEKCIQLLQPKKDQLIQTLKTDAWDLAIENERSALSALPKSNKYNIHVIDISTTLIDRLRKQQPAEYSYSAQDIRNLQFSDETFDLIIDWSTIDHVPSESIGVVINEYSRVLKKNGVILLVYARKTLLLNLWSLFRKLLYKKDLYEYYQKEKLQYFFRDEPFFEAVNDNPVLRPKGVYYFGTLLQLPCRSAVVKIIYNLFPQALHTLIIKLDTTLGLSVLNKPFGLFGAYILQKETSAEQSLNLWNQRAEKYKDSRASLWDSKLWNTYIDFLYKMLLKRYLNRIKKNDAVLDVGCGTGRFLRTLGKKTDNLTGIDALENVLSVCRESMVRDNIKVNLFKHDLRTDSLETSSFSHIFSIVTLSSLINKEHYEHALKNLIFALKPGGNLVMIERFGNHNTDTHIIKIPGAFVEDICAKHGLVLEQKKKIDFYNFRLLYVALDKLSKVLGGKFLYLFLIPKILFLPVLFVLEYFMPSYFKSASNYMLYVFKKLQ